MGTLIRCRKLNQERETLKQKEKEQKSWLYQIFLSSHKRWELKLLLGLITWRSLGGLNRRIWWSCGG